MIESRPGPGSSKDGQVKSRVRPNLKQSCLFQEDVTGSWWLIQNVTMNNKKDETFILQIRAKQLMTMVSFQLMSSILLFLIFLVFF